MDSPGIQDVWYLKLNDRSGNHALWLRFSTLRSRNGFRQIAEIWGVFFERQSNQEVKKLAIKESASVSDLGIQLSPLRVSLKGAVLGSSESHGEIQSKGHSIKWDLRWTPNPSTAPFRFTPRLISKIPSLQDSFETIQDELVISGIVSVDGQVFDFQDARGLLGHGSGTRHLHSWTWAHCNSFIDASGNAVPACIEILRYRPWIVGTVPGPSVTVARLQIGNSMYLWNRMKDSLSSIEAPGLSGWKLQFHRSGYRAEVEIHSKVRDFSGITYEDTDGSLLYCSTSKLSDMTVTLYQAGKIESALMSSGTTAYEIVKRTKSPYVSLLL